MTGTLYGIGVGPGDPELMTLKAVRLIEQCDLVAVPKSGDGEGVAKQIAQKAVPDLTKGADRGLDADDPRPAGSGTEPSGSSRAD